MPKPILKQAVVIGAGRPAASGRQILMRSFSILYGATGGIRARFRTELAT
jgi:hypothetical protein